MYRPRVISQQRQTGNAYTFCILAAGTHAYAVLGSASQVCLLWCFGGTTRLGK